jgi:hypothetical protein
VNKLRESTEKRRGNRKHWLRLVYVLLRRLGTLPEEMKRKTGRSIAMK